MAKKEQRKEQRFVKVYDEASFLVGKTILVDRVTGVNYLWVNQSDAGGITPLLDAQGRPVVTPINDHDFDE